MASDRRKLLLLVLLVAIVVMANAGVTTFLLYNTAWEAQRSRLVETVRSQACLIEAVAAFHRQGDHVLHEGEDCDWQAQTLAQVQDALGRFEQSGHTSEFTLATRDTDQIVFLIQLRHVVRKPAGSPQLLVPWASRTAEPMRLALSGKSGTVVGIDYRNETVLAAYQPLPELGWGIVAKIDVAEIRAPYFRAIGIAAIMALVAVGLAAALILHWTTPVLRGYEESERRVQAILEGAQDGIITFNKNGDVETFNPAAEKVFGYDENGLAGVNVVDLLQLDGGDARDDFVSLATIIAAADNSGRAKKAIGHHRDGSAFSAEVTINAAVLADRQLYTAIVRDVTEHRSVQRILRESKSFLQTVIDSLPDGLMVLDLNHQVLLANATIRKQLGNDASDTSCFVCYRSSHGRNEPCSGPEHPCPMQEVLETKSPIIVEHTHTDANGDEFPVEIVAAPVFDEDGNVVRIIECCRDLSDRRRAEEQLKESELRHRELYEASRDGYNMVDLNTGRILDFNTAFREMLGYADEELRNRPYSELCPAKYREMEQEIIDEQVLRRGYSDLYEKEYYRKDGVLFPAEVRRYICKDRLGRPTRMWAFVRNVEDRKRSEATLKAVNAELEARNKEISQLVYTVSHDLKSPLVTIQGFTGRIQRDTETGKMDSIDGYVKRVQNAADRMARLLDDLLEFNRIGRITAKSDWIDLRELVGEIVAGQDLRLKEHDVVVDVQEDMPVVFADRGRLSQLFDNLIGNAIEYGSDACDARIEIGAVKQGEDEVHIFVKDNGPGIPAEFHDRIFELFQRLRHDSLGSGVGLSVVKRIAEVHGGRAWVDSQPGQGATFWVSLRLPHEAPEEAMQVLEVAHG